MGAARIACTSKPCMRTPHPPTRGASAHAGYYRQNSSGRLRALLRGERVLAWLTRRAVAVQHVTVDLTASCHDIVHPRFEALLLPLRGLRSLELLGTAEEHESYDVLGGWMGVRLGGHTTHVCPHDHRHHRGSPEAQRAGGGAWGREGVLCAQLQRSSLQPSSLKHGDTPPRRLAAPAGEPDRAQRAASIPGWRPAYRLLPAPPRQPDCGARHPARLPERAAARAAAAAGAVFDQHVAAAAAAEPALVER